MEDANPSTSKRPRAQASGSGSGSAMSSLGKGVTEQMSLYAAPIVMGIKQALTKRAILLRSGARQSANAAEALDTANREGKIVRSIEIRLSEEQKRLFLKLPPDLQDQKRKLCQAMQMEALKARQEEARLRALELDSILKGSAFAAEANQKLDPDAFSAHPSAAFALKELIRVEQESFHLELAIKFKKFDATEAAKEARRAHKAQRREQVRMQVEQEETSTTLKRYVEQEFRKAKPALLKELKAAIGTPPSKQVHFKPGTGSRPGAEPSRGRPRARNKPRSRSQGRSSSDRSSSRGRSATPRPRNAGRPPPTREASKPRRRTPRPSASRSSSRGNGNGDRGTPSRRPPSGKHGGGARVGGGGGSKTGRRR